MKELLLKIRALLSRILDGGEENPLAAGAAVALSLLDEGDLFAGGAELIKAGGEWEETPGIDPADPVFAAGAAYALMRENEGGVVVCLAEESERKMKAAREALMASIPDTYVVQEGDTLYKIATRFYGKSSAWKSIREANKESISTDGRVRAGMKIRLPK